MQSQHAPLTDEQHSRKKSAQRVKKNISCGAAHCQNELLTSVARSCDKCQTIVRHLSKVHEAHLQHCRNAVTRQQSHPGGNPELQIMAGGINDGRTRLQLCLQEVDHDSDVGF
jgi:hypothetical protein